MPQFYTGEEKTATLSVFNPKAKAFDYEAFLYMGTDLVVMAQVSFHLEAEEAKEISMVVTMPQGAGTYPVYIGVFSNGQFIEPIYQADDVVISVAGPSALLIEYQRALDRAYHYVETGRDYDWIMVPGWGLQYAYTCVYGGMTNPATMQIVSTGVKDLMIEEAVRIGMITSSIDCYFVRAIMYYSDGTTIVPYWWPCPYCAERFRSPEARGTHINEVHWDIINTKAVITSGDAITDPQYPVYSDGVYVTWRNDSPFAITGRLTLCEANVHGVCLRDLGYQDALAGSGQSVRLNFMFGFIGSMNFKARLILVGEPLPGMLLDEMLFRAGEEPEL